MRDEIESFPLRLAAAHQDGLTASLLREIHDPLLAAQAGGEELPHQLALGLAPAPHLGTPLAPAVDPEDHREASFDLS